jgi:hypothetical protein
MTKPEDDLRDTFLQGLAGLPPKVQIQTCIMAMLQVLNRFRKNDEIDEVMEAMGEFTELLDVIEGLHSPSTREH